MYKDKRVAVVVPAYNEELLIAKVIGTMPIFVDHIVVVDDGSRDGTARAAEQVGDDRLNLVVHERNTGVGGAVVTGHKTALALGADVICIMSGDAQCDPAYLESLVSPVVEGTCDMAKGNRFYSMDSFRSMPSFRILGNVFMSFLVKFATGYWRIVDPLFGYLAVNRTALERIPLDRISKGYSLENDTLINLNIIGATVMDVPIPALYGDEVSKIKLYRDIPSVTWFLFKGFWRRIFWKYVLWSFSPIALFLVAGIALSAWGALFGLFVVINTLGPPVASTGTVLLSVGPLLLGLQLILFALVLDIQEGSR